MKISRGTKVFALPLNYPLVIVRVLITVTIIVYYLLPHRVVAKVLKTVREAQLGTKEVNF